MRKTLLLHALAAAIALHAQQVTWLTSSPVDFTLNPAMARHEVASAPGHLVAMRTTNVSLVYSGTVYGSVALDALDPVMGDTWLSCLLTDSVSVGDAVVSPAGIAYFTGRFTGDVLAFCDGSQLPGIGGFLTENHFLMAWNLNTGMPLWTRNLSMAHPDAGDVPSLALDPDGNLWYLMQDFQSGRVVRVDDSGNDVEVRPITGIRRFGTLSFDPWGGLYVSGSCENGTLTFGGQVFPVSSAEGYNMFVLRYKPDGTAGFAEFGLDITFTNPTVMATTDGHAYLAGDLNLGGEVWPGLSFTSTNWGADVFIAKLDSTGQFLWGREAEPNGTGITGDAERAHGPCLELDAEGGVYLLGTTRGSVTWGSGIVSGGPGITERRLTLVAFDADGTPQWALNSNTANWFVTAQAITGNAETGALHFAAHTTGAFTFGPFTTNSGGGQAAVFGRIGDLSTGTNPFDADEAAVVLWPNPAHQVINMELDGPRAQNAQLMNCAGQHVRAMRLNPGRNRIDAQGLPAGLYLLRLVDGGSVRVVVE